MLCDYLKSLGFECVQTREPGGTPVAEKLRDIVKYSQENISDEAELLLFNAARSLHINNLIKPAVERGAIVICDRFADSTTAYQGYGRNLDLAEVKKINSYAVGDCSPDLTLLLDIDQQCSFKRINERNHAFRDDDRFENAGTSFHDKVRFGFLKIAEKEPARVKVIDASGTKEEVHRLIREKVDDLIK